MKVEMVIGGKKALVNIEHVDMFATKQALVKAAMRLQKVVQKNPKDLQVAYDLGVVMGKIIKINRKIKRKNAFVEFPND